MRLMPKFGFALICAVSVLNLHEDERQKPQNWIPIGWMPIYDDKQSKCKGQGYESNAARKARLFHDCFRTLLSTWDEKTKHPQKIVWGDQVRRQTRFFLGGLMGDQQVILTGCFGDSMHNYFQFALLLLICSDYIFLYLIVSNFLYCFFLFVLII